MQRISQLTYVVVGTSNDAVNMLEYLRHMVIMRPCHCGVSIIMKCNGGTLRSDLVRGHFSTYYKDHTQSLGLS